MKLSKFVFSGVTMDHGGLTVDDGELTVDDGG